MTINGISSKVPGWIGLANVFPVLSPKTQGLIRLQVEAEQERQLEQAGAAACGLTLDEYRLLKSLPAGVVDWSKVGK